MTQEVIQAEIVDEELVAIDPKFKWIYDLYTDDNGICKMEHSPLGASSSERMMNCPGSVAVNAGRQSTTSVYAAEGTLAHSVGATLLRRYLNLEPHPEDVDCSIGSHHTVEGYEFTIDEDFLDNVWVYVALVQELIEKYGLDEWGARIEQDIHIPSPSGLLWGKGDAVLIVMFDRVIVIDLKFGRGKRVLADRNPQLRFYALGALESISESARETIRFVDMFICQPRHSDGVPIMKYTESVGDLKAFKLELLAAEARITPDAPRKGGSWCEWCAAQGHCEAEREYIEDTVGVKISEFPAVVLPQPINYTIEMSARIWRHKDLIDSWVMAHYNYLYREMEAGRATTEQTGLKFVEGQTKRRFKDRDGAIEAFKALGVPEEDLKKPQEWKSPKGFEDTVSLLKREKKIDVTVKEAKEILAPFTEKPQGAKTLVSVESTKRAVTDTVVASKNFDLTKVEGL